MPTQSKESYEKGVETRRRRNEVWTPDVVRRRIQASKLVERLQKHVDGSVKMTATQVRAAEILLKKSVPDLSSVEISANPEGAPVVSTILIVAGNGTNPA